MEVVKGIAASAGLVMGPVRRLRHARSGLGRQVGDPRYELALYEGALCVAQAELTTLEQKAAENERDIFMVQRMMLEDGGLADEIRNYIRVGAGAAAAVERAAGIYAGRLRALHDNYLSERAADVLDACHRVVDILDGGVREMPQLTEPSILAAEELYPTDIVTLERSMLLGFVTAQGAESAHVSILARMMGVPAVVQAGQAFLEHCDGKAAALDGEQGVVYFAPDEVTKARFAQKKHMVRRREQALELLRDVPCETLDGTAVALYANCTSPAEVHEAIEEGAQGIGLLRSDYTRIAGQSASEDEQYHFYAACVEAAQGKPVTVSTYDLGGEGEQSPTEMRGHLAEQNPALGVRGVRYCFAHRTFFLQQLCALLRAAVHGPLRIVLPMVTTPDDFFRARAELENARAVLRARGIAFAPQVPLGVLVETPSAALLADTLAAQADFFNIGTNDLTQFVYAADRTNPQVQQYLSTDAPAVTRLVQYVSRCAAKAGISACVTGESAADLQCAEAYVRGGVRALSMATRCLPEVKAHLRAVRLETPPEPDVP